MTVPSLPKVWKGFLAAIAILIPFSWLHAGIEPGVALPLFSLGAVLLLTAAALWISHSETPLVAPLVPVLATVLFIVWSLISLKGAVYAPEGLWDITRSAGLAALLLLASHVYRAYPGSDEFFTRCISIALAGLCVWGFAERLIWSGQNQIHGTFGNPGIYASALIIAAPVALAQCFAGRHPAMRVLAGSAVAAVPVLCMIAEAWSALIAYAAAFAITLAGILIWLFRHSDTRKRTTAMVFAALLIIAIAVLSVFAYPHLSQKTGQQWDALFAEEIPVMDQSSGSMEERFILWRHTMNIWSEHPVTGVGAGQWKLHIVEKGVRGFHQLYGTRYFLSAHNDVLQTAAETGYPGLILYLIVPLAAFLAAGRSLFRATQVREALMICALTGAVISFAVISLVEFPKERVFHSSVMVMAAAALFARTQWRTVSLKLWIAAPILMLSALWMMLVSGMRFSYEEHQSKLLEANTARNWSIVKKEAKESGNWLFRYQFQTGTPLEWYSGTALFAEKRYADARSELEKGLTIHPAHPLLLNAAGSAAGMSGDLPASENLYARALAIFPDFTEAAQNLADVMLARNKAKEALEMLTHTYKGPDTEPLRQRRAQAEERIAAGSDPGP